MSRFRQNILANYGGQFLAIGFSAVSVPVYMHYIGTEGFGLVGFFLSTQALVSIFDFGLSVAANQEINRLQAVGSPIATRRDFLRTLEVFYAVVTMLLLAIGIAAAPFFAHYWFQASQLDDRTLQHCFELGAAAIAVRWPLFLYHGIMRGIERQVEINVLGALANLLRTGGTIAILMCLSNDIVLFFSLQALFAVCEVCLFMVVVWRHFATDGIMGTPSFKLPLLRGLWRFSFQVGGASLFAVILKQLDKIIVSRLLPIEQLGFYNTAGLASSGLTKIVQPLQVAAFPRMSAMQVGNYQADLASLFHRSCYVTAFLVSPCASVMIFFPYEILSVWTQNSEAATTGGPVLSWLAAAMLLNCQMNIPFTLQLATGLAWLPLMANGVGVAVIAPLLYWLIQAYGLTGAAAAWFFFNLLNMAITPALMFRRVLPGHYFRWIGQDVLPCMLLALACVGGARWLLRDGSVVMAAFGAAAALCLYGLVCWFSSESLRSFVQATAQFRKVFNRRRIGSEE